MGDTTRVACLDGKLAGAYELHPSHRSGTGWLNYIAVLPEFFGQGIGLALLEHFELEAQRHGFGVLALDAFDDNVQAHGFYLRNGYQVSGTHADPEGVKFRFQKELGKATAGERKRISAPSAPVRLLRRIAFKVLIERESTQWRRSPVPRNSSRAT